MENNINSATCLNNCLKKEISMNVETEDLRIYNLNFWHTYNNYGATLTAYALQCLIMDLGNNCELVNNVTLVNKLINIKYTFSEKFWKKYLKTTNHFKKNIESLNKLSNTFITGSDQVFRPIYQQEKNEQYMLDFVKPNAKKIAFAASFGVDKEQFLKENSNDVIQRMKNSLKSFDFISVREKSGVEICKDLFDVEAKWIIDPVFILDKSNYNELIKDATINYSDKIVSYVLDSNSNYKKAYKHLAQKYDSKVIQTADSNISIENWLASIKNCKLFITDSFHGMCFAIIFNKPFICIANKKRGRTRFDSILEMLEIDNQCIDSLYEIYEKDCVFNFDLEKVNNLIKKQSEIGLEFLETALKAPVKNTEVKMQSRINYLECKILEIKEKNKISYKIKNFLWNVWLVIFYNLPKFMQNIIRFFKNRGKHD